MEELVEALRSFPKGSSGGLGGLMPDHLVAKGPMFAQALTSLATLTSAFAWNRLPPTVSALIAGEKLVLLSKKQGGIRPVAVGELLRCIAGKVLFKGTKLVWSHHCTPSNWEWQPLGV